MITITNHRQLRWLGFEAIAQHAFVGLSWRTWLELIGRRVSGFR